MYLLIFFNLLAKYYVYLRTMPTYISKEPATNMIKLNFCNNHDDNQVRRDPV